MTEKIFNYKNVVAETHDTRDDELVTPLVANFHDNKRLNLPASWCGRRAQMNLKTIKRLWCGRKDCTVLANCFLSPANNFYNESFFFLSLGTFVFAAAHRNLRPAYLPRKLPIFNLRLCGFERTDWKLSSSHGYGRRSFRQINIPS